MTTFQKHAAIITVGALLLVPSCTGAQSADGSSILRSEIRTSLLSDPRAREISAAELNSLIEVLAVEAEAQEVAVDFLPPPPPFIVELILPLLTPWGQPISAAALYGVILLCLGLALLLLKRLAFSHRSAAAIGVTD